MTPAVLDFLNSREKAMAVWAFLILAYVFRKDPRGVGGALWGLLRAFLQPRLVLLYGSALGYAALVVYAAARLGVWHTTALKATVYWFVGTAVILVAGAVQHGWRRDPTFVRRIRRRIVGVTLLIEFAANLYALPFVLEFIAVGLVITGSMMQAYLDYFPGPDPRVRKLVDSVVTAVGLVWLGYFALRGIGDLLDASVGRDRVEDFLVAPALTVALIPFLHAVVWLSRREHEQVRRRFALRRGQFQGRPPEETAAELNQVASRNCCNFAGSVRRAA